MLRLYDIDGTQALGSCLRIYPCSDGAPDISECTIQWFRSTSEDGSKELISGIMCVNSQSFASQYHNLISCRVFEDIIKLTEGSLFFLLLLNQIPYPFST